MNRLNSTPHWKLFQRRRNSHAPSDLVANNHTKPTSLLSQVWCRVITSRYHPINTKYWTWERKRNSLKQSAMSQIRFATRHNQEIRNMRYLGGFACCPITIFHLRSRPIV